MKNKIDRSARIKQFIFENANTIQRLATQHHKKFIGGEKFRSEISKKHQNNHIALVQELARHLEEEDVKKGLGVFKKLAETIARDSVKDGLYIEEAVGGIIFLKQALWETVKKEGLLTELAAEEFYSISQTIGIYIDIVSSKIAFIYHDQSQRHYKSLIEKSSDVIALSDAEGNYTYVTPSIKQVLGYKPGEFIKMHGYKRMHPDEIPFIANKFKEFLAHPGLSQTIELRGRHKDGSWRWIEVTATNLLKDQTVGAIVSNFRDITARKKAEEEAKLERRRLHDLFMQAPIPIAILKGTNHVYEFSNPLTSKVLNVENPIGKSIKELFPDNKETIKLLDNIYKTGQPFTAIELPINIEVPKKGTQTIYVNAIYQPLRNAMNKIEGIMTTGVDVTDQVVARRKVEESESRLQLAQEAANIGTFEWDLQTNKISYTLQAEKIFGFTPGSWKGNYKSAIKLIHPEDRARILKESREAIDRKKPLNIEHRIIRSDKSIRWLNSKGKVICNDDGKPTKVLGVIIDITDKKELEHQKDDFMGIVSHELKTPVTSIKAFTQVLERRFAKAGDENATLFLGKMDAQINKLTALISDLLDVTKIEGGKLQFNESNFSFDELAGEVVEEVQRTTGKHKITLVGRTRKTIYGDRDRIGQVIINFLTNAIKYSPNADKVIVTITKDKNNVICSVEDFGIGIPKEMQPHIFKRFYRVNGNANNTIPGIGLGLYISSVIIERQNGKMWVKSEEGKGSLFSFSLPASEIKKTDG